MNQQLHELNTPLNISISIPEEYKNAPEGYTRTFYFGRVHEGVVDILTETTLNVVNTSSDKFSTYALAYKDVENKKSEEANDDTNENSSQDAKDNANQKTEGKAIPDTSDETNTLLWFIILIVSLVTFVEARRRYE